MNGIGAMDGIVQEMAKAEHHEDPVADADVAACEEESEGSVSMTGGGGMDSGIKKALLLSGSRALESGLDYSLARGSRSGQRMWRA